MLESCRPRATLQAGALDVFGQLSDSYVEQSAPHMAAVANMARRLLGDPVSTSHADIEAREHQKRRSEL